VPIAHTFRLLAQPFHQPQATKEDGFLDFEHRMRKKAPASEGVRYKDTVRKESRREA
jgi:hypothetical protein